MQSLLNKCFILNRNIFLVAAAAFIRRFLLGPGDSSRTNFVAANLPHPGGGLRTRLFIKPFWNGFWWKLVRYT